MITGNLQQAQQDNMMLTELPNKDLTGIAELEREHIELILDLADRYLAFNRRIRKKSDLLDGLAVINLFLENSTRTRVSFEIAAKRLGADVVNFTAEGSSLGKGESFEDTIRTLNAMQPGAIILRHTEEGAARRAAELADVPVINGGDGCNEHPTQALLDAMTIRRKLGKLDGVTVAICGDIRHSRVAASNTALLSKMGATVKLVGPEILLPEGGDNIFTDMKDGLADADIVMALRLQRERIETDLSISEADYAAQFGLTAQTLAYARPGAYVMHPGPINRGVEIAADVADHPERSLILQQVEHGVAVRMACMDLVTRPRRNM